MSKLGKVCLIVAVLATAGSLVLAFLVSGKKKDAYDQLSNVDNALKQGLPYHAGGNFLDNPSALTSTINRATKELKDTQTQLQNTQTELESTKTDLGQTKGQLTQLQNEKTVLERQLTEEKTAKEEAQAKVAPLEARLKEVTEALKGAQPQDLFDRIEKAETEAKTLSTEKKILDDRIAELTAQVNKFKELDELRKSGRAPMSLSGKVVAINKPWSFVILDIGKEQKLVEGVELTVYRGDTFVGKVRTVTVDANTAVADILGDWSKGEIQVGDQVIF
jgi:predicted RNase H-like nuclease (RuvC/YqgF family)